MGGEERSAQPYIDFMTVMCSVITVGRYFSPPVPLPAFPRVPAPPKAS